ncbi:DUF6048 family protein [Lutibacter sp.]
MNRKLIYIFITSFFISLNIQAQENDTLKVKEKYGLRLGIDLSKPINALLDKNISGFEIQGDFRVYKNYYIAAELGYDDKTTDEDYLNFTTQGSYIKVGVNYNAYKNWKGMNNEVFVGVRYGLGFFSQTLNSYTPNVSGTYFIPATTEPNTKFENLTAQWAEFIFGIKVETLKNFYLGASVSLKSIINTKEPENFKNLYIPGFNRVYLNNTGVGFNYTLSYLIPLFKK